MSRVLVTDFKSHRSVSLRTHLIKAAEEFLRQQRNEVNIPNSFKDINLKNFSASAQMEVEGASAHGDSSSSSEQTSNVVIQDQTGSSVGSSLPSINAENVYKKFSAAESKVSDETLHDRWFTLQSFDWTGQAQGSEILRINVPHDIFNNANFKKSPNYAFLSRHAYWRGDLEFRLFTNTNVRQYGQLQFSFYYGQIQDKNFNQLRNNIYSASHRTHSLMTANFSNTVIIKVPFEYIFPVMAVNILDFKLPDIRHLGSLIGLVVIPLTAVTGCPNTVNVKVQFRMLNNSFSGMVGIAIAEAEMLSLASIIAVKSLLDRNRDNPTMISPGMPVIPVNSSSWCYGTGQSQFNNVLRLNPNEVLPYESGRIPPIDEMTINNIRDIFGMIAIEEWSKNTLPGSVLFKWDAAPLSDLSEYPSLSLPDRTVAVIPPIGVLSSLFAYWRGSMRLRIDIVGATELSGSLLICYVPRVNKERIISMEDAYTCAHAIYDIHENRQIIFDIPFVASHMFWPRRNTLSLDYPTYRAPGAVYVFCYNQLVVNCAIPDNCHLVFYLAGNSDFEVAVPACPSVGLGFNRQILIPTSVEVKFIPKEGYSIYYTDYWHSLYMLVDDIKSQSIAGEAEGIGWNKFNLDKARFKPNISYYPPICRYGATSDHISQFLLTKISFPNIKHLGSMCLAKFQGLTKSNVKISWVEKSKIIEYPNIIGALMYDTGDYIYALPVLNSAHMKIIEDGMKATTAAAIDRFSKDPSIFWCCSYFQLVGVPGGGDLISNHFECTGGDPWMPNSVYLTLVYPSPSSAQADEKENIEAPPAMPQSSASVSASRSVFGEQFLDLKDYCRRFQLFASDRIVLKKITASNRWRSISIRFPVLPQGLELDLGDSNFPNEYWNRTREGPIPLIASGFRFFTGGIRFRIAINITAPSRYEHDANVRGKLFVQHRPNIISKIRRVQVQSGVSLGTDDIELPGYASYHQFDDINNVLSIEVPFYMPTIRSYLQEPSNVNTAQKFSSLGELAIGLTIYDFEEIRMTYDIYYALADDARFSVFVGFPPMFDITKIPNLVPDTTLAEVSNEIPDSVSEASLDIVEVPDKAAAVAECMKQLEESAWFSSRDELTLKSIRTDVAKGLIEAAYDKCQRWVNRQGDASAQMGIFNDAKKLVQNSAETSGKVDKLIEKLDDNTIEDFKETIGIVKKISQQFENFNIKDSLTESIGSFQEKITSAAVKTQENFSKYSNLVINAITNLMHCLISRFNPKSVLLSLTSFFCQCKLFSFNMIHQLQNSMMWVFRKFGWASEQPELEASASADMALLDERKTSEDDEKALAGYVSTLVAGIAAMFGIVPKLAGAAKSEITSIIIKGLDQSVGLANKIYIFVKNNLLAMQRIKDYIFNDHPSVVKLGSLRNHEESLYSWAREVLEVTDPRKSHKVMTSPRLAAQVYEMAAQANILKIDMLKLKLDTQEIKVLDDLIKKVHDLRDRLARCHMAPPVRFEPFVYELTGRVGIGKSELMKKLPYEIFKFCNFTHEGELIYHRALGNAYWNNLQNQPVCTIDEKFPISGPNFSDIQLAELFQLKSSCIFNPPMADIPDKNIRYNPLIVQYGSNNPFPVLPEALDKSAVDRRRDCLIEVAMTEELIQKYKKTNLKYSDLSASDKKNGGSGKDRPFAFLRFRYNHNVTDRRNGDSNWGNWMNYSEFKNSLCQKFKAFYQNEERKYRSDIELMKSILPRDDDDSVEIADVFKYDWLEKVAGDNNLKINRCSADSLLVNKIKDNYSKAFKYDPRTEAFSLKMRVGMYEAFGAEPEVLNPMLNRLFDLEGKKRHPLSEGEEGIEYKVGGSCMSTAKANMDYDDYDEDDPRSHKDYHNYEMIKLFCVHEMFATTLIRVDVEFDGAHQRWIIPKSDEVLSELAQYVKRVSQPHSSIQFASDEAKGTKKAFSDAISVGNWDTLREDDQNYYMYSKICNEEYFKYQPKGDGDIMDILYTNRKFAACACKFANHQSRAAYIKKWWLRNLAARECLLSGENLHTMFPSSYLAQAAGLRDPDSITRHEEIITKFEKFKNWFREYKESLLGLEWKKWGKRLAIVVSIFSFLGVAMGLWQYFSPGSKTSGSESGFIPSISLQDSALLASVGTSMSGLSTKLGGKSSSSRLTSGTSSGTNSNAIANGHVSGDYSVKSHGVKLSSKPAHHMVQSLHAQAGFGVRSESALEAKIIRNSFFLSLHQDRDFLIGRCIGICGQYALLVDHFYEAWAKESKLRNIDDMVYISGRDGRVSSIPLRFSELKYFKISDSNLCLIKLPKRFPNFSDIRSFIAPRKNHQNLNNLGRIYEFNLGKENSGLLKLHSMNTNFENYYNLKVKESKLWKDFTVHIGYHYPNFNGAGKCGSLLCANGLEAPIIGMHIAGFDYQSGGVAECIYREMFEQLENCPRPHDGSAEGLTSTWYVDSSVIGVGRVPAQFAHQERGKSRIVPSEVQLKGKEEFGVFTQPAVLSPKDPRIQEHRFGPMTEGCKHHGKPLIAFSEDIVKQAIADYESLVLAHCKPMRRPGLLTVDEAIGGFEAKPGYEHLEFDTSEGFPFVGLRPRIAKNKRWLFNFDDRNHYESCNELLKSVLDYKWQQRIDGEIPFTVFTDCLKDCTIEHSKVLEPGKTRIFSMSPVDFTIQQRQCTLDFVVAFMASRRKLEHMIGCNPDSVEWTWLAQDLLNKGSNILTGDYSKYGDTVPFEFIEAAFQIIQNWYKFHGVNDQELIAQLRIMPYEIGHAYHLMFDHIYQVVCGQPSGNSLTVIINSIANSLYLRCAWLSIMRDTQFCSLSDMHKHIQIFSYGDDLIVSLSDDVKELFNAKSLHEFFAQHGLKFTNADKGSEIVAYTGLDKAEFLKRGFTAHPTRVLPQLILGPLKRSSIEDTPNWVWSESFDRSDPNSPTFREMSMQVCADSVRNAFGRGPEYYEEWRNKIKNFWLKQGEHIKTDSWEIMDHKIFTLKLNLNPYNKWLGIYPVDQIKA